MSSNLPVFIKKNTFFFKSPLEFPQDSGILYDVLPDGVTVAQLILVQFVLVRIQVGQPF